MEVKAKVVKTFPAENNSKTVVSLTIDDCFAVHGIKIIESAKGLFIAMPSEKFNDKYKDICHPISKEFRQAIIDAVMEAYQQTQSQEQTQPEFTQSM